MDPVLCKQIVNYLTNGTYPDGLTKVEKNTFRKKAHNYDVEDGQLFYIRYKGTARALKAKVLCGTEDANAIFTEFHASTLGAHCGQKKTRDAISKRFYWPGMSSDIDTWVAQCVPCQASQTSIKQEAEYTPIVVNQPFELIAMDLIGKLSATDSGNQYICVIMDYLTKWPQAYALRSKSATEVTDCLLKFVYQFETPKRVLTDQGKEFVNNLNKHVCKILQIKRSLCAPYHPQTNGLVERMNGVIQRALCKLVQKKPKEWDKHLDAVMFGLRTKKQITTKYSPYFLMFGREARYPSEIPEHYRIDSSVEEVVATEDVTECALKLHEILSSARENIESAQEKVKTQQKKSSLPKFHVGDRVWRLNVRSQQRKGGKLDPNYLGPFTITKLYGKSADLEDDDGVTFPKINIDHLRHHREDTPRIPHKLQKDSYKQEITSSEVHAIPVTTVSPVTVASPVPSVSPVSAAPSVSRSAAPSVCPISAAPLISPISAAPSVSQASAAPSVSPVSVAPSVSPVSVAPSVSPVSVAPSVSPVSVAPSVSPVSVAPSVSQASMAPSVSQASAAPSVSPVSVAPSVSPVSVAPSVSQASVAPSVSQVSAAPSVSPVSVAPSVSPVSVAPSVSQASVAPSVSQASVAPSVSPVSVAPSVSQASVAPSVSQASVAPSVSQASVAPSVSQASAATSVSTVAVIDKEKCLREAWQGKDVYVLLSKIGPYKIYFADIRRTAPNMEVESEVMNAYMHLLIRDFNGHSPEKAVAIDTFEMSHIWKQKRAKVKLDPLQYRYILGIINENCHWTLMVVIPSQKKVLYLDPLGENTAKLKKCQEVTRSFMRQKGLNVSRWECNSVSHPCQKDSTSCGPFVLKFAECILKEKPVNFCTTVKGLEALRKEIATALLQNTDDLNDLCHFCGERENTQKNTDWIGCERCPRWYHVSCVRMPAVDTDYICDACHIH